ncbi:hypothetical protein SBADM41S_03685 [Streptomyces badius]
MFSAEVDFIVPELTLAHSQPSMAELIPLAEALPHPGARRRP